MALSDIMGWFGIIFTLVGKLGFMLLCFYFGNLAFKGWKGKKNIFFKWFSVITFGLICFFGGLILKDFIGWDFFASEYVCSIIIAAISYLLLLLISTGFKIPEKYASKNDINSLVQDVKDLKIQVAKLTKALEDKKMIPELMNEEDIKKELADELGRKDMKKYELLSVSKIEDAWSCIVKTNKGRQEFIVDAYTGHIIDSKQIASPLEFIYKKPFATLGIALFIGLLIFLGLNISLSTVQAFNDAFDFSFLFEQPLPEGCLQTNVLLENFQTAETAVTPNNTLLSSLQPAGFYIINGMTKGARVDGSTYYLTTAYNSPVSSLGSEISLSNWQNIYNVRVCSYKSDYTLCECIGGEQTDAVFTVPYLIQLGLIEEALQNAILGGLSGALGGGLLG